jgi:uncharacterized C2H2 Zn-finger protein
MGESIWGRQANRVLKCAECAKVPICRPIYQDDLEWSAIPAGWFVRKDDFGEIYFVCPDCAKTFRRPKRGAL